MIKDFGQRIKNLRRHIKNLRWRIKKPFQVLWQWIKKPFQVFGSVVNCFYLWAKKYSKVIIFVFILILFIILVGFIFFDGVTMFITKILNEKDKTKIIELIGLGIGGLIATIAVISLGQRAAALDAQNKLVEKGHIQERFKTAVEHLGNSESTMRIASFYEFYSLARDNQDLRQSIFDILCAYLRKTTGDKNYQENEGKEEPTEEIQSLLNLLFKKDKKDVLVFDDMCANLKHVYLIGANLTTAILIDADLRNAILNRAVLEHAHLYSADLTDTKLTHAVLKNANLGNASLIHTNLTNANLDNALLLGASLIEANLNDANLKNAYIENADLRNSCLAYTSLIRADLKNANLTEVDLTGANLTEADLTGADLTNVDLTNTTLYDAKLNKAIIEYAIMPDGWEKVVHTLPDGTVVNE